MLQRLQNEREFKLIQSKYILLHQLSRLYVYIENKLLKECLSIKTNNTNTNRGVMDFFKENYNFLSYYINKFT